MERDFSMELEPHQRDGHTKVLHQLLVNIASELLAAQSEVHRSNGARCVSFPGRAVDDHLRSAHTARGLRRYVWLVGAACVGKTRPPSCGCT